MKKKKYKLESVSITATYDKSGNDCYLVTERWIPRAGSGLIDEWEYKYRTLTFERANEIARARIGKYGLEQK